MCGSTDDRTESERVFQAYLTSNGYNDWDYEPEVGGQSRRPDYLVRRQACELLFEVKELRAKDGWHQQDECHQETTGHQIEYGGPCEGLRQEINEARKKFKKLKEWCCSLVVRSIDDARTMLDPTYVFSAMLGDITFTLNWDPSTGKADPNSVGRSALVTA